MVSVLSGRTLSTLSNIGEALLAKLWVCVMECAGVGKSAAWIGLTFGLNECHGTRFASAPVSFSLNRWEFSFLTPSFLFLEALILCREALIPFPIALNPFPDALILFWEARIPFPEVLNLLRVVRILFRKALNLK